MVALSRVRAALTNNNTLFRNTLTLISGTVATQAIVFLFSPALSRIFPAADFGNLANYNAWVTVLALIGCLRYDQAVIVARDPEKANRVLALTAFLLVINSAMIGLVVWALWRFYTGSGYLAHLRPVLPFIPLGVLVTGFTSYFTQYNIKIGGFRLMAGAAVVQVVSMLTVQISLGLFHVPNALIIGSIGGLFVSCMAFGTFFLREYRGRLWPDVAPRRMWATAIEHFNFPRYMLAADVIGVMVQQFAPVFVLALFDAQTSGLYAFSIRVVRVPMIVISAALTGALRKEAADIARRGDRLSRLFMATVGGLSLLSIVPLLITLFFAPTLFGVIFGTQWLEAGRIVQILSPGILMEFIALPLSAFFLVTNTQHYSLIVQSLGFVLLVAALFYGKVVLRDFSATCYLISAAMFAVNALMIGLAWRVAGTPAAANAVATT